MKDKANQPKTLQEAIRYFADPDNALAYMVRLRWPDGVVTCPKCGRNDVVFLKNQRKWQCKSTHDHRQFSAKVGTIFEDSPIPLDKWLTAVWMLSNCRNGVSSYEIGRTIGVTQKSAWFMLHRSRLAMQGKSTVKLGGNGGGEVEADETFIGGKARNMHKSVRARRIRGQGFNVEDKTTVMGILERGGRIRAHTSYQIAARKLCNPSFVNMSPQVPRCSLMNWLVIKDSLASTSTRLLTMQLATWMAEFIPMAWRTSGVC